MDNMLYMNFQIVFIQEEDEETIVAKRRLERLKRLAKVKEQQALEEEQAAKVKAQQEAEEARARAEKEQRENANRTISR